ncbi:hypothetical protein BDU57DRAFT_448982 [Ampelomyces quisqualis]|uniref:RNB domain-containing protein n=1 Tax=Ampelomyces quisqualis TaxID=50730 RepID=A0A6A5QR39_AMPQU|nr:hypothetical protein BDU57DRAFT_448982 [Ampelomyces quisqualis]
MPPRSLWTSGSICWSCQSRLRLLNNSARQIQTSSRALASKKILPLPQRTFYLAARPSQGAAVPTTPPPSLDPPLIPPRPKLPFRHHLEQWQAQHGGPSEQVLEAFERHPANSDVYNGLSKLNSAFKADDHTESVVRTDIDDDEVDELITIGLFLKPGDVVELSQPGREPVLAVFVQQLDTNSQFFSVNGRWCHSTIARVAFAITGCIDPSLLNPLVPFLPTSPHKANPKGEVHVPSEVAQPVQAILERMTDEADQIYRANAPVLDTAYMLLADPKRTRMMTLAQIAKTLLAQNDPSWTPSPAALLAVRKSLHHNEFRFRSDIRSHRLTNIFAIRPKEDVQLVDTVHQWIREYREHLAISTDYEQQHLTPGATNILRFLEKARRIIAMSRETRDPNIGTVGPSKANAVKIEDSPGMRAIWSEIFTSTDKQIIDFLQAWVLTGQFVGMGGLHAACTSLIMATGCYEKDALHNTAGLTDFEVSEVKRATGVLFLQEIGVITPFENRALYDEQLMLPTVRSTRNLELLTAKAERIQHDPGFRDSMKDLRHDWGSTTVYCIDDVGAQEIDDGVSIERVRGKTSQFWVHVHVANPTAFLEKTHVLSGFAAHMTETVYTPERSFPMLPPWAAHGHFSLDRNRPVLTFSSRIDHRGNVLETKIQPGIIQNVVSLTPSEVSSLLGHHTTRPDQSFVVGGKMPDSMSRTKERPKVSAANLQDLKDMWTAAHSLWNKRRQAGGVRMDFPRNHVRVFEASNRPGLAWNAPSTDLARLIAGDPIIEVTSHVPKSVIHFGITPANIVEEMMMLACTTAASWCKERNIPVMFRGTVVPPNNEPLSSEELKDRFVLPHLETHGEVPHGLAMRYVSSLGRAIAHFAPIPHKIIGAPAYVKVTSPLRRFSDMIAHWQIEAAIRYEAQNSNKFYAAENVKGARGILPFTERQMLESIITLSPRERIISTTKRNSARFWSTLALFRAFHYKEASLPDVFRFWVRTVPSAAGRFDQDVQGVLPDYGYQATFTDNKEAQLGDEWEVQLERIDMFFGRVYVKPVRLLRREKILP